VLGGDGSAAVQLVLSLLSGTLLQGPEVWQYFCERSFRGAEAGRPGFCNITKGHVSTSECYRHPGVHVSWVLVTASITASRPNCATSVSGVMDGDLTSSLCQPCCSMAILLSQVVRRLA